MFRTYSTCLWKSNKNLVPVQLFNRCTNTRLEEITQATQGSRRQKFRLNLRYLRETLMQFQITICDNAYKLPRLLKIRTIVNQRAAPCQDASTDLCYQSIQTSLCQWAFRFKSLPTQRLSRRSNILLQVIAPRLYLLELECSKFLNYRLRY